MIIKQQLRKILWKAGWDLCRFTPTSHALARRKHLIGFYRIDTVLDIGANSGQFALQLRHDLGYAHNIFSFEPLSTAFSLLESNAKDDPAWKVFNFAIADTDGQREINISKNSVSSSLLNMLPSHLASAPGSEYIGTELVYMKRLDSIFETLCKGAKNVYLKIDTQGFEINVLKGAESSLTRIDTVQLEMSLIPLYDGHVSFGDICIFMGKKGYTLVAIENGFSDATSGHLLQVDGIFHRL